MGCEHPGGLQLGPDNMDVVLSAGEHPSAVAYHMVNRRYSEFLNLQTRLEEKAELRKLIKGKAQSKPALEVCRGPVPIELSGAFRCERTQEDVSRHAVWKHGQ